MSNKTFAIWMCIGLGSLCLVGILNLLSGWSVDFKLGADDTRDYTADATQHREKMEQTFFIHKKHFELMLKTIQTKPAPQVIKITRQNYPALAEIGVIKVEHLKASNPILFYLQTDTPDREEGYLWSGNYLRGEKAILFGDIYDYPKDGVYRMLMVYSVREEIQKHEKWYLFGSSFSF